ncbi:MAG: sugar transferase [Clostridiaceae bacterium]|nr:sugar transferase [Clostridiaceae bacterium]
MTHILRRIKRFYKVLILFTDIILLYISYIFTYLIRFSGELPQFNVIPFLNASPYILIAAVIFIDLYKVLSFYRKSVYDVLKSVALVVIQLGITTIAVTYMLQGFSFPRTVLVLTPVIQFILVGGFNVMLLFLSRHLASDKKIMIITTDYGTADVIIQKIDSFLKNEKVGKKLILDLSQEKIIMRRLKEMDEVYLSADVPPEFKAEIIRRCMGRKQVIYVVPHLFEISLINARLLHLEDTPTFMVGTLGLTAEQAFVKRIFDVTLSLIGIIILSPLLLTIAILVKSTSKGPAFYKQERITKNNKKFTLIKFRTMKLGAEDLTGPVLSEENDPRVTWLGKILRKTRIDELPQLINVIKGDMSLVGPRPERPFFVEQFIQDLPEYEHRFSVKAGITGYAQLFGNYSTSPEDKLRYDLMYIRNYSLLLDIKLIFKTISVLFSPGSFYKKHGVISNYSENTGRNLSRKLHARRKAI